jgi:hypothetical protein
MHCECPALLAALPASLQDCSGNVAGRGRPLPCSAYQQQLHTSTQPRFVKGTARMGHCCNETGMSREEAQTIGFGRLYTWLVGSYLAVCSGHPIHGALPFVWTGSERKPELKWVIAPIVTKVWVATLHLQLICSRRCRKFESEVSCVMLWAGISYRREVPCVQRDHCYGDFDSRRVLKKTI